MNFKLKSVEEIEKLTTEEQTQYFADKAEHQKAEMIKSFDAKIEEQTKGFLSKNEAEKLKEDFSAQIKGMPIEELNKYNETIKGLQSEIKTVEDLAKEIKGIVKTQGEAMRKMEGANTIPEVRKNANRKTHIQELIKQSLSSKEFEAFKSRGFVGASNKMVLGQEGNKVQLKTLGDNGQGVLVEKATVSTTSHTGTVLISEVSDIVRDDAPTRVSHVRDLLNVSMTNQAQVVAGQVYDFTDALTLGAVMLSENGQAPESVFKSKENTWGLKRIANSMRISKREIAVNGLDWVMDKVLAKLPDAEQLLL